LVAASVPTVPLFSADDVVAMQKHVKGYVHHPSGWYYGFRNLWLEK
jgi:ABC-type transport system substrate-binding protein